MFSLINQRCELQNLLDLAATYSPLVAHYSLISRFTSHEPQTCETKKEGGPLSVGYAAEVSENRSGGAPLLAENNVSKLCRVWVTR